jgi:hypothetical protein
MTPNIVATPISALTWEYTAVRRRSPTAAAAEEPGLLLLNAPLGSKLVWDTDSAWAASADDINRDVLLEVQAAIPVGLDDVDSFISEDTDMTTTDIGYAAQAMRQVDIQITCADRPRSAHGIWTGPQNTEVGVVMCGNQTSPVGAKMAASAQNFCS